MIRVVLPTPLRPLAGVGREVTLEVGEPVTLGRVLDRLEAEYPRLAGTLRDVQSGKRRPFVRFFACQQDISHEGMALQLPAAVADGAEPLLVVGAMAGG